ncbi:hypothetical protein BD324DRAFT_632481 [Kockovaella imperatae]|uniref:Pumilio domain-containing protein c n=1 Tax=Kockovaella imperatae TaxID=4999 RepID=A0A1Y1UBC7_9TREE|nr:hypothetical protein BD324DRAFT_632481 [Kockovaella imperatae]ORX35343.1 hypothetical protein BD324DRAFT_632481 [Kockovaella imperatae]
MPSPPRPSLFEKSSSLSPDPPKTSNARAKEGRTPPPPAPSAAFAKRARETVTTEHGPLSIGEDEGQQVIEDEVVSSAGYRRARAGTLPSSLEAPPRFTTDEPVPPLPMNDATPVPTRTSALSPAYPVNPAASRPGLRHANSTAGNVESPSSGRNRSGSLTLPKNGVGNAFGSSAFSNAWLANPSQARTPLGQLQQEEEQNASTMSDSAASLDLNFSTLDYLGLEDGNDVPPASMAELRNQAQRAIANSGPASRHRASTVSNFARPHRQSVVGIGAYGQYDKDHGEELAGQMAEMGLYDANEDIYNAGGYGYGQGTPNSKDSHRPRATTIAGLDGRRMPAGGFLSSIPQSPVQANMFAPQGLSAHYGYPPRTRAGTDAGRQRDHSQSRAPRMSFSSSISRATTPDVTGTSTPQVPTRSLWIGNLDVGATSAALLHVFAPYGAIESVRMLPEKTCAFVNFMEKGDAIRARDDVLNRMGGHVTALSETAPVRIGFGKIDSAPSASANGTGHRSTASASALMYPSTSTGTNGSSTPAQTLPPVPPLPANIVNLVPLSAGVGSLDHGTEISSMPTRALWIGSIPGTTSSATLLQIFSPFGPVESARVLMHKCCGFVNFERLDSAVSARTALNGRDILGSDVGPIRIGFARVPTKSPVLGDDEDDETSPEKLTEQLSTVKGATSVSTEQQVSVEGGGVENYRSQLVLDLVKQGVHEQVLEKGLSDGGEVTEQQMIMSVLSGGRPEEDSDVKAAAEPRAPSSYYTAIPIITERPHRRFDSPRLKDMRRQLDGGPCTLAEIDAMTDELMEDCAELASDYIGNTVIQKLFERCSPRLRRAMLEKIAPHLAMIGIHKNGTWAAQKIIECSHEPADRQLIVDNLRPFAPPLMCDSLGNYVCAGTLRFGGPWNSYVFDAMIDRMWDIAQSRFGARCMRTCLESNFTSLYQKKRISAGIILNSIPLATNPNGALLLTWLVDQSNLPGRYGLLSNRFAPHIAHLCTHKLASLTVLRIISQTAEPHAASSLLHAIFTSAKDSVLLDILGDANNGAQVIGKMLAISTISAEDKSMCLEACRRVLPSIKAASTPPYRVLLEAVGLPIPSGHMGQSFAPRPVWGNQGLPSLPAQHQMPQHPAYGYYPAYHQPSPSPVSGGGLTPGGLTPYGTMGQNLSPLLVAQNMPLQPRGNSSPKVNASPRTPLNRHRGRLSPASQMMSPGSDPFNPFASPSIDMPYFQNQGLRVGSALSQPPVTFEPQPNVGGLGIMGQSSGSGANQMYYGQMMQQQPSMFAGYRS